ncbi:hypothetical protein [Streptomyces gardneri]|uniref:Uncharacterized protein n=1 Tax=Streptomyces gardneri TaxID=66892 RepID=A0A4Y3RH68_9ACTN|nr:hypothetical protein [Streptomyces gardneri]GEB57151.1 hypothetical protein SGA01_27560 [Streptomyces gardneri]GHH16294.1 hypothetical protein GCM10017674_66060 [Streptomyces gardneri]
MPQQYRDGRSTGPATWRRTPENLARPAKSTLEVDALRRRFDRTPPPEPETDAGTPAQVSHRQHQNQARAGE